MFDDTLNKLDIPNMRDQESRNKEMRKQYNPYMNNEGSVLVFKGQGYVLLASDTRLSTGYSILSRDSKKIFKLTEKAYLCSSGMYADIMALVKQLKIRIELYKANTKHDPSIESLSQLLSTTLYGRRFFPYYAFNVLAGVTDDGQLKLYGYDAIGSFDTLEYAANGSGKEIISPILDSVLKYPENLPDLQTGEKLALTAMNSCANRDIYTGDTMDMIVLFPDGKIQEKNFDLRKD